MQLGLIGLGRMGSNMARRWLRAGHALVVHDIDRAALAPLEREGARAAASPAELVAQLAPPRAVWLMVPAAGVDAVLEGLAPLLEPGDTLIDGGNSRHQDDWSRARALAGRGLHYLDVGTSGGVWGLERGYCLMIGGEPQIAARLEPLFAALAPDPQSAPKTPGAPAGGAERGYLHCGPHGAGHFAKMVHNGIEYGLMAAYAEGFNVLRLAAEGGGPRAAGAPAGAPGGGQPPRYEFDVAQLAELWRRGSVIGSWLLDLTARALAADPQLAGLRGRVADSGEGRWLVQTALEQGAPVPVLGSALFSRFASRGADDFANRLLSALSRAVGGHPEADGGAGSRRG
jgi:6-phosphogluconate dehydrogenase